MDIYIYIYRKTGYAHEYFVAKFLHPTPTPQTKFIRFFLSQGLDTQNGYSGEPLAGRSEPGVDEQGRQRLAADFRYSCGPPKHAGPRHPLRQHSQEEMGRELCVHGPLCLRRCSLLLGGLGLPDVVWQTAPAVFGPARHGFGTELSATASIPWQIPERHHGLFPVRFRSHNADSDSRSVAGEDELPCMDAFRAALGYDVVYCLRF